MWTARQTDTTKLIVAYCNVNEPKKKKKNWYLFSH